MPSVTYMNSSAPFWDFVASLDKQAREGNTNDPWYSDAHGEDHAERPEGSAPPPHPFGDMFAGPDPFHARGFPWRGGRRHRQENRDAENENEKEKDGEKAADKDVDMEKDNNDNGEGPSGSGSETEGHRRRHERHGCRGKGREHGAEKGSETEDCRRRGGRGRCGEGRRGRHAWGGPHHGGPGHHGPRGFDFGFGPFGPGPHGPPPPGFGPHGPRGNHHERGPGGRGGFGGPWGGRGGGFGGFNPWAFAAQFLNPENYTDNANTNENENNNATKATEPTDFSPEADIFDAPTTFVIHVSLPGAKKEDVGVNWDAEKSELSVAGVIYRPGDEDFLKTLAMNERKVGPFERKVRLGTRVNPAQIDAEGITAKLEDGILRIEVPKRLEEGFVEIRKVDVE